MSETKDIKRMTARFYGDNVIDKEVIKVIDELEPKEFGGAKKFLRKAILLYGVLEGVDLDIPRDYKVEMKALLSKKGIEVKEKQKEKSNTQNQIIEKEAFTEEREQGVGVRKADDDNSLFGGFS